MLRCDVVLRNIGFCFVLNKMTFLKADIPADSHEPVKDCLVLYYFFKGMTKLLINSINMSRKK